MGRRRPRHYARLMLGLNLPVVSRRSRIRSPARAPLIVLALVSALSLGARAYRLDEPCQSPCTTASEHPLIYDENYYVDAAQVIAGIRPPRMLPAGELPYYQRALLGTDPNAEHPQGAKLVIAGAIELFGNGPFAWRIGSLLFGSLAILGMYALVRSAGGRPWLAVGAATLMAADPLMIVSGRIGMLDIYALAPMVWGIALYLRGRVLGAAVLLAVADCMKEVSVYAVLVLGLVELFRVLLRAHDADSADPLPAAWTWRPALARLTTAALGSAALFILGLWVMGLIAPPSREGAQQLISGGPFGHLSYMINFAKAFNSPGGLAFDASYPWQWLLDLKPITYLSVNPSASRCVVCNATSVSGLGPHAIHPVSAFVAMISPPIIALAIPALIVSAARALRQRPASQSPADIGLAVLAVAWFVGTWAPYELQSALDNRISYLYYMIGVMPGIYVAVTYLVSLLWRGRSAWLRGLVAVWGLTVLAAAVVMFPFLAIL
jgi:predicted membrane-bound dolichyl-phosphate-mannose-protein mannosyltransferase